MNQVARKQNVISFILATFLATTSISLSGCWVTSNSSISSSSFSKLPEPKLKMSTLPEMLRGDYEYTIEYSPEVNEKLKLSKLELQFSDNGGESFTKIKNLSPNENSTKWKTPGRDIEKAALRVVVADSRDNQAFQESHFEIRHRNPIIQSKLFSEFLGNETSLELKGACEAKTPILLELRYGKQETSIASEPKITHTDACLTGNFSYNFSGFESGFYQLRLYQVDPVGHETEIQSKAFLIDHTPANQVTSSATAGIVTVAPATKNVINPNIVAFSDEHSSIEEVCYEINSTSNLCSWQKLSSPTAPSAPTPPLVSGGNISLQPAPTIKVSVKDKRGNVTTSPQVAMSAKIAANTTYRFSLNQALINLKEEAKLWVEFSEDFGQTYQKATQFNYSFENGTFTWVSPDKEVKNASLRIVLIDKYSNHHFQQHFFHIKKTMLPLSSNFNPTTPQSSLAISLSGTCEAQAKVSLQLKQSTDTNENRIYNLTKSGSPTCSAGNTYSHSFTGLPAGYYQLITTQTDSVGNTVSMTESGKLLDNQKPSITEVILDKGNTSSRLNNIPIQVKANDVLSKLTSVCYIFSDQAAATVSNDSCWTPLETQTFSIDITSSKQIGDPSETTEKKYYISVFVKDTAGNISEVHSSSYRKLAGAPIAIANLIATFKDNSLSLIPEVTAPTSGKNLFVFWKQGNCSVSNCAIVKVLTNDPSISVTANCSIQNISDSPHYNRKATCALDSIPTDVPLFATVDIQDNGLANSLNSNLVNTGKFKPMAGNTSLGFNFDKDKTVSATANIFNFYPESYGVYDKENFSTPHSMAILSNGTIVVIDFYAGLIAIEPSDAKATQLIQKDSESPSHDDGNLNVAKIHIPLKVAVDQYDRLWVLDRNAVRLITFKFSAERKIDRSQSKIETIMGGFAGGTEEGTAKIPNLVKNRNITSMNPKDINILWPYLNNQYVTNVAPYLHHVYFEILPSAEGTGKDLVIMPPAGYFTPSESNFFGNTSVVWNNLSPQQENDLRFEPVLIRLKIPESMSNLGNAQIIRPQFNSTDKSILMNPSAVYTKGAIATVDSIVKDTQAKGNITLTSKTALTNNNPSFTVKNPIIEVTTENEKSVWKKIAFRLHYSYTEGTQSISRYLTLNYKFTSPNTLTVINPESENAQPIYGIGTEHVNGSIIHSDDGRIFAFDKRFMNSQIFTWNSASSIWEVAHAGKPINSATCKDNTILSECPFDLSNFYVKKDGDQYRYYFQERGLIRTINSANIIQTLYGLSRSYDNDGEAIPLAARFGRIFYMRASEQGHLVVQDDEVRQIRYAAPGKLVKLILGNGESGTINDSLAPQSTRFETANWSRSLNFGLKSVDSNQFDVVFNDSQSSHIAHFRKVHANIAEKIAESTFSFDTNLEQFFVSSNKTAYDAPTDWNLGKNASDINYSSTQNGGLAGYFSNGSNEFLIRNLGRREYNNNYYNNALIMHELHKPGMINTWWILGAALGIDNGTRALNASTWLFDSNFPNRSPTAVILTNPGHYNDVQMQGIWHDNKLKWLTSARTSQYVGLLEHSVVNGIKQDIPTAYALSLANTKDYSIKEDNKADATAPFNSLHPHFKFELINTFKLDETTLSGMPVMYYCSTNGKLYKAEMSNLATPKPQTITHLPLPQGIRCDGGRSLEILKPHGSSERYVVFPYTENGLYAIGGYKIN